MHFNFKMHPDCGDIKPHHSKIQDFHAKAFTLGIYWWGTSGNKGFYPGFPLLLLTPDHPWCFAVYSCSPSCFQGPVSMNFSLHHRHFCVCVFYCAWLRQILATFYDGRPGFKSQPCHSPAVGPGPIVSSFWAWIAAWREIGVRVIITGVV